MSVTSHVVPIFSAVLMVVGGGVSSGQDFPNKPIRIVSSEAGSAVESLARIFAPGISASLGQPVIVENRPSTRFGEILTAATPDGYTVVFAGGVLWLTPLVQKTSYDPVRDFSPITMVAFFPYALVVHPSVPVKSVKELIDLAKAKPGALNYASGPVGGETHLGGELFKTMAGVDIVNVRYKGTAPAFSALMGGETQLMFNNAGNALAQVKSGKLRALAITTAEPSLLAPDLPTMAASGLRGYELIAILGILAPRGTPSAVVNRLSQEVVRVVSRQDVKEKFLGLGSEVVGSSPAQFSAKIKSEIAKWAKVIKDAGIRAE